MEILQMIPMIIAIIPFILFAAVFLLTLKVIYSAVKGEERVEPHPRLKEVREEVESLKKEVRKLKEMTADLVIKLDEFLEGRRWASGKR